MNGVADKDSPWKEAWRIFLRSMLRVCFPELERAIDWRRDPQFLDKELQQIFRGAARGRERGAGSTGRRCDKGRRAVIGSRR